MRRLAVSSGHCDNPSFVGSAWWHYSARHAALRSGSNEPLVYDGLGSTRQLINHTDQSVTDTYEYEAFGNNMSSSGSTPNPYQYVGSLGYYQTGTSLMHLGARYYMPEAGRFISADPATAEENPYVYSMNSPTTMVDPAGLLCIHLPWHICIGKGCKGDPYCPPKKPPKPKPPKPKPSPPDRPEGGTGTGHGPPAPGVGWLWGQPCA